MPFDLLAAAVLPADSGTIHGVPRHELAAHAMAQIPPALRSAVAEIEVTPGRRFVHMGMMFDQVDWRAAWRRPGLPAAAGSFPVWNGSPV
jgi:hypothetical protein